MRVREIADARNAVFFNTKGGSEPGKASSAASRHARIMVGSCSNRPERCEAELTAMRKSSLEACFTTNLSNTDKDFLFCQNFFRRKKNMLTQEQEKMVDAWTEKICGDGAEVRPAVDAELTRVIYNYT